MKHIHASSKMELAELIVKSAPIGATSFRIAQKLPPDGYLVDYKPPMNGLSIHQLAVELGLESKVVREAPPEPRYSPSIQTQLAVRVGKKGFVLHGGNVMPLRESEDRRFERKLAEIHRG